MATSTATRTKQESRIQMRPKYPQQQPGQPFFLRQVPASLTPGPARLTARLRRKSGPIIQPTVQIKMRPEYLPPLVIPLRKSSSSHRIRQLQQQQRIPCPVYRPQPIHPIPALPAPTYAPPPPPPPSSQQSPTQAEIHELAGDIPSPTPQTPNHHHPDSAMSLNLEPIPMTESPQPVGEGAGGKGTAYLSDLLDQETLTTLKAYYRHTLHLSPAPIPSPGRAAGQSSSPQLGNSTSHCFESNNKKEKNKLHRSSAIYVRNPRAAAAANANLSTKSNQGTTATTRRRRRTAVFPSWSWRAESKHQQDSDRHNHLRESEFQVRFQNQDQTQKFSIPAEPLSIQPTPDIIEGIVSAGGRTTRLDTYTSVLDDWERDMIDARLDTKEEEEEDESHQPAEELVNEFGEREKEALKDLMGFLDEVLGCSSTEETEEQTVQVACGLEEGSLWWRDVRRSLV